MDPTTRAVLAVCMRWIHIASVVALLGGLIYARLVLSPALATLAAGERETVRKRAIDGFRPLLFTAMVMILGSGAYNYATKASYPPHYHMWFGIKVLLALHVFAAVILYRKGKERALTGVVISGGAIVAISAYLRWLSLNFK